MSTNELEDTFWEDILYLKIGAVVTWINTFVRIHPFPHRICEFYCMKIIPQESLLKKLGNGEA